MRGVVKVLGVVLAGCFSVGAAGAQSADYFSNWPEGTAPQDVGKKLAEHFVVSPHQYLGSPDSKFHYSEVVSWYGALTIAKLTHDDALRGELVKRFEPLMPGGAEEKLIPQRHHVDDSIFGLAPMEIGMQTHDDR